MVLELDYMVLSSLDSHLKLIKKYGNWQGVPQWRRWEDCDSSNGVEMVPNFFKTMEYLSRQMLID